MDPPNVIYDLLGYVFCALLVVALVLGIFLIKGPKSTKKIKKPKNEFLESSDLPQEIFSDKPESEEINLFLDEELNDPNFGKVKNGDSCLDSFGSGSGLLDLSLQLDDTSLGGIFDEIYPPDTSGDLPSGDLDDSVLGFDENFTEPGLPWSLNVPDDCEKVLTITYLDSNGKLKTKVFDD